MLVVAVVVAAVLRFFAAEALVSLPQLAVALCHTSLTLTSMLALFHHLSKPLSRLLAATPSVDLPLLFGF
jgi:hypothetical protein